MGLTPFAFVRRNTPKCKNPTFGENWTSVDVLGPAADVWGLRHQPADVSGNWAAYRTPIALPRVREEVDLGQIHVPAQGFDIVDEMVAPVGGGVLRAWGVAGSP